MGEMTAAIMPAEMGKTAGVSPFCRRAAAGNWNRSRDQSQRAQPQRAVPLRSEQADAPGRIPQQRRNVR
jgi:hypothetical protein